MKVRIALVVLFVHALFLGIIIFGTPQLHKAQQKPLLVRTLTPHSPPKAVSRAAPSVKPKAIAPSAKQAGHVTLPPAKPTPKAAPPSPKPVPAATKKNAILPKPTQKSPPLDGLLHELQESIAKIEERSDKSRVSKAMSTKQSAYAPVSLQIDALTSLNVDAMQEGDYVSILTQHLHEWLHLPEYGEVKIQLVVRRDGSVVSLAVLEAKSEKNKKYLEANLPTLRFPPLEGVFAKAKDYSFVLTFCNE